MSFPSLDCVLISGTITWTGTLPSPLLLLLLLPLLLLLLLPLLLLLGVCKLVLLKSDVSNVSACSVKRRAPTRQLGK
jgi:hypothetical protein